MAIADWLNVTPTAGSGSGTVSVKADANDGAQRSTQLTISGGGVLQRQ